jgi:hypothetical protein
MPATMVGKRLAPGANRSMLKSESSRIAALFMDGLEEGEEAGMLPKINALY